MGKIKSILYENMLKHLVVVNISFFQLNAIVTRLLMEKFFIFISKKIKLKKSLSKKGEKPIKKIEHFPLLREFLFRIRDLLANKF